MINSAESCATWPYSSCTLSTAPPRSLPRAELRDLSMPSDARALGAASVALRATCTRRLTHPPVLSTACGAACCHAAASPAVAELATSALPPSAHFVAAQMFGIGSVYILSTAFRPVAAKPIACSASTSWRRSLHDGLRALGFQPVTHSVFRARTRRSAVRSLTRGGMLLLTSATFAVFWSVTGYIRKSLGSVGERLGERVVLRLLPHSGRPAPKAVATYDTQQLAALTNATSARPSHSWFMTKLRNFMPGNQHQQQSLIVADVAGPLIPVVTVPSFGAVVLRKGGLVLGAVVVFSCTMGLLRVLGWTPPSRDSYMHISENMAQPALAPGLAPVLGAAAEEEAAALDLPPEVRASLAQRLSWSQHVYPLYKAVLLGPCAEEMILSFLLAPAVWVLCFIPGAAAFRVPLRVLLAGGLSAMAHDSHKRPSAALLAATGQVLAEFSSSPASAASMAAAIGSSSLLLPSLFHALVNWLTCDMYAAVSPLCGLQLLADGSWSDDPAAQAARARLRDELQHFFDPCHQRLVLRMTVALRSTPLLRMLIPARKHAMFLQAKPKPKGQQQRSAWREFFSRPAPPSPLALSARYTRVVTSLFALLDPTERGWLEDSELSVLLLLLPEHLELLRGAFVALDQELSATEYTVMQARLWRTYCAAEEAAVNAPDYEAKSKEQREQEAQERLASYQRLQAALTRSSEPLESSVVHLGRQVDWDDRGGLQQPPELPFPCAEWLGLGKLQSSPPPGGIAATPRLSVERMTALGFLRRCMEQSGFTEHPQQRDQGALQEDDPLEPLGWQFSSLERMMQRAGMPGHQADGGPLPRLSAQARARARMLLTKFRAYTHLVTRALFRANLDVYGEDVPDDNDEDELDQAIGFNVEEPDEDEEEQRAHKQQGDEEEEKAVPPAHATAQSPRKGRDQQKPKRVRSTTRRFTVRSLYALLRDRALLDVYGTDALMAQAAMVLQGTVPHPMHVFNSTHNVCR